ncbi:MAG: V-type ATP synthase subunit F [Gallionellaceae bacterium]
MNAEQHGDDNLQLSLTAPARLIAFGSSALMEGFELIGFETFPDPTPEVLEMLFQELLRKQQAALVVIEQGLAQNPGRHLMRAQSEGGRIIITEIPEIMQSANYHSRVENLVQNILGPAALEIQE